MTRHPRFARAPRHAYRLATLGVLAMGVGPLQSLEAQERGQRVGSVPRDVSREVVAVYNAPGTRRVQGDVTLSSRDTVRGDMAVLNGRARVEGVITGQLVVINGDVHLANSARIDGNVTVIGGTLESPDRPQVTGEIRVWSAQLRYHQDADTLVADTNNELFARWSRWQRDDPNGSQSQLFLTTAHTYNRTEGLPIYLGPRLRVRNGNTGVEAELFGIFRTSDQLDFKRENLGHRVRLEFRQGRRSGLLVGGRVFDEVDAVEKWQLSNSEVGLASFLVTRDYRDYWQRHGGTGYIGLFGRGTSELRASFGEERWTSRRLRNVPTLFNADVPWRSLSRADEGVLRLFTVAGTLDTRNRADDPRSGWLLKGDFERGTGTFDAIAPTTDGVRTTTPGDVTYSRAFFDLRRYNRLGPGSQLNVRAVAGGWVSGDPLPLQRRVAVSGIDALPGFDFRQMVGANDAGTCATGPEVVYTALGRPAQCERMLLLQAEWKGDFRIDPFGNGDDFGDRRWAAGRFRADGAWVLFVNSGRGWLVGEPTADLRYADNSLPPVSTWRTDVGGGFDFGSFGVYVAQAVSESSLKPNFYVRLGHRF